MEALRTRLHGFACSSLYRSDAMYVTDQPGFVNAVATGYWSALPRRDGTARYLSPSEESRGPGSMHNVDPGRLPDPAGAEALLEELHAVERQFGRNRQEERRHGPRPLDLDLLLYGGLVIETSDLVVPHPRMEERRFVLLPLLELDGSLRNPRDGRPFAEALAELPDQGVRRMESCPFPRDVGE